MKRYRKFSSFMLWIPVVLWMILIFYLSHQPSSSSKELSSGVMMLVINTLNKAIPVELDLDIFHQFVRKSAHFFAYFILGVLILRALKNYRVNDMKKIGFALILCIVYASSDEIHQLFIPGRSGEVRDVIIDSTGALTGLFIYWLFVKLLKKRQQPSK